MSQRITDLVLSLLAALGSVLLSWPYWRDFSYWAESPAMWWLYVILGYVLVTYVFYAFLGSMHTLFLHDAQMRKDAVAPAKQSGERP